MRILNVAALVWFALAAPATAQTADADLMAPIQKFVDSFNKGDAAAAAATHAAGAAQMTFVLKRGASGSLIHGWTWTGPQAQSATAPAKK